MTRQQSKRKRAFRQLEPLPNIGRVQALSPPTYIFRKVIDPSSEQINEATRFIKSKGAERILDNFSLTLVYPDKLSLLREHSRLTHKPRVSTMAGRLGSVASESLRSSVTANVIGVEHFNEVVGIRVSYPGIDEEISAFAAEIKDLLRINNDINIGPGRPHISIVAGRLAISHIKQIEQLLPETIELGCARSILGPI